jgi:large subunit ribosomal protein L19
MNSALLQKVESSYLKEELPSFSVGDTVKVHNVIREGDKSRVQIFRGIVIATKGSGTRAMFTVRKISDGIGVEKIFPLHSPNVQKVELIKSGKVRRSKLYFMRSRVGKQALKVKAN